MANGQLPTCSTVLRKRARSSRVGGCVCGEASGGAEATIEDLADSTDVEGVLETLKEPTRGEGGEGADQVEEQFLRPLTKARIRRAIQSCKAVRQRHLQASADTAAGSEVVPNGKGRSGPDTVAKPATPVTVAGRKAKMSAVLDQRSEAEVERLTTVD
eukprot:3389897-Amphidinium_carterae.1